MSNAVRADALHHPTVCTPVLREVAHMVVAAVVDGAGTPLTCGRLVNLHQHHVGVFESVFAHGITPSALAMMKPTAVPSPAATFTRLMLPARTSPTA